MNVPAWLQPALVQAALPLWVVRDRLAARLAPQHQGRHRRAAPLQVVHRLQESNLVARRSWPAQAEEVARRKAVMRSDRLDLLGRDRLQVVDPQWSRQYP